MIKLRERGVRFCPTIITQSFEHAALVFTLLKPVTRLISAGESFRSYTWRAPTSLLRKAQEGLIAPAYPAAQLG
jgi:hypothetical protein